ncbi:MAG: N-acetyltransferase family protein [Vicinamibacterales bacterium]
MPPPIVYRAVSNSAEVRQIHALQAANHPTALTAAEMAAQGFVTVRHDLAVLQRMSDVAPGVIATDGDAVVGYALVMPREFAADVPILRPLFAVLEGLQWRGRPLRDDPRWFVMGQICVAEGYRGAGIFDGLYRAMAEQCRERYDFTVTEVAARNTRSLRAHRRVGFETIHVYPDDITGEEWHVIALALDASRASLA